MVISTPRPGVTLRSIDNSSPKLAAQVRALAPDLKPSQRIPLSVFERLTFDPTKASDRAWKGIMERWRDASAATPTKAGAVAGLEAQKANALLSTVHGAKSAMEASKVDYSQPPVLGEGRCVEDSATHAFVAFRGSSGGRIVWCGTSGKPNVLDCNEGVFAARVRGDGQLATFTVDDDGVAAWRRGPAEEAIELATDLRGALRAGVDATGTRVALLDIFSMVHLYDLTTREEVALDNEDLEACGALLFNADGTRLMTVTNEGVLRSWDTTTGHATDVMVRDLALPSPRTYSPTMITASSDGSRAFVMDRGRLFRIDVASAEKVEVRNMLTTPTAMALSPDGSTLFAYVRHVNLDCVYAIDAETFEKRWSIPAPDINQLEMSADGRTLVGSGIEDFPVWRFA